MEMDSKRDWPRMDQCEFIDEFQSFCIKYISQAVENSPNYLLS